MGSIKASIRDKKTNKLYYYLIEYEIIKGTRRHHAHLRIIAKGYGIAEAVATATTIIDNHIKITEDLIGCTYKLLKWDRLDHRPRYSNVVVSSPILKTKL